MKAQAPLHGNNLLTSFWPVWLNDCRQPCLSSSCNTDFHLCETSYTLIICVLAVSVQTTKWLFIKFWKLYFFVWRVLILLCNVSINGSYWAAQTVYSSASMKQFINIKFLFSPWSPPCKNTCTDVGIWTMMNKSMQTNRHNVMHACKETDIDTDTDTYHSEGTGQW